ncbi:hypothetical protein ABZP36_025051 [Zizania latifolia]
MDMETATQERERHQCWWPLDTMACSLGDSSCFLYGWVPQLRYFGLGVVGVGAAGHPHGRHTHTNRHELELELFFPKFMDSPASEAAAAVTGLATPQDTRAMYEEFDELLQNFLDAKEEQIAGFDPSCFLREDIADITSLLGDDAGDDLLAVSNVSPMGPILPVNNVAQPQAEQQQQPPSSASSHCNVGPRASDTSPVRANNNCSSKRSVTPGGTDTASSKRSRSSAQAASGAGTSVVYPFTVVKPGGLDLDGGVTLADINARILTPPAKPIRHPVGEFAGAPRSAAGSRLAPSGKTVASFTRLHTAGRGTVTVIKTTGQ